MQTLHVLQNVELVLGHGATLHALQSSVEGSQSLDLHLLRVEQHLQQTTAELLHHAVHDVGGVNTSVLCDVIRQLTGVQTLQILHTAVPLAVSTVVLVLVLVHFINNLRHTKMFFMVSDLPSELHRVTGSRFTRTRIFLIASTKLLKLLMQNKLFPDLFSKSLKC